MSEYTEQGLVFSSGDDRLVGIAAIPEVPADTGVLILVGGPQYRVGSHRQFTLLARELAGQGIASLRFDYAGMGDSEGAPREFNQVETDISAAMNALFAAVPGLSRVVLWGLCDAASSAMMYAHRQDLVSGLVLLNPWVHSGEHSAQVKLAHYYRPLLADRENWRRLFSGQIRIVPAVKELASAAMSHIGRRSTAKLAKPSRQDFAQSMLDGIRQFEKDILVVLSDDDLTAGEYSALLESDGEWREVMSRSGVTTHTVVGADHTFSRRPWLDEVSRLTIDWVKQHRA